MPTVAWYGVSPVRANGLPRGGWQSWEMTAAAPRTRRVCQPWQAPRQGPGDRGKYAKPHRRYAGIKPLRNALHQFSWQATLTEPWALDYDQRQRAQGKTHSVAVRALANIWGRIIFARWTKREGYQRATFEAAQKGHAPQAA